MAKKRQTKSPLKSPPRRVPGQSVDEEIGKLLDDELSPYVAASVMLITLAAYEWWRWWSDVPPQPVLLSICALGFVVFASFKVRSVRRRLRALKLGRDGERAVGQFLDDKIIPLGYRVFHDLVGDAFNVDHVLVGPAGLFTIETKTISKPAKGQTIVRYDGTKIMVDGFEPDRDPLVQAKAQAAWLRDLAAEATGQRYEVRPVVLYPGWFVESPKGKRFDVLVMSPKALPSLLEKSRSKISESDVKTIAFNLSRHARGNNAG